MPKIQVLCIMQSHKEDLHPVGYYSWKLTPQAISYSAGHLEALAILWSIQCFAKYLQSSHVFILQDLNLSILKMGTLCNKWLLRWVLFLQAFQFAIEHIPNLQLSIFQVIIINCIPFLTNVISIISFKRYALMDRYSYLHIPSLHTSTHTWMSAAMMVWDGFNCQHFVITKFETRSLTRHAEVHILHFSFTTRYSWTEEIITYWYITSMQLIQCLCKCRTVI